MFHQFTPGQLKVRNPKVEIPNFKHQITDKFQIPIFNDPNKFEILFSQEKCKGLEF
jgi:hypothetical protein